MIGLEHAAELVVALAVVWVVLRVWVGCKRFGRAYRDWRNRLTSPVEWTQGPRAPRRWW